MSLLALESEEFGRLNYAHDDILVFPGGLTGFEDQTRFLHYRPPSLAPIEVLLSLVRPGLRFYALPVSLVSADYQLTLTDDQRTQLSLGPSEPPSACLVLLAWPADNEPTVNLLAPVVLNTATHCGLQAIQFDSGYPCRYPLRKGRARCS